MLVLDPALEKTATIHSYLLGAVAPRPIAFASTIDSNGNPNLSPFSFFNCFGAKPPIVVFSPARRVRDNTIKHTLENIKETGEVVINMVNFNMVQQTSLSSVEYPKGVNEFIKAGFTPIPSQKIKPFRVKESPVQLECVVKDIIETGENGGAGNLVICEVVLMHIDETILDENQRIDPDKIDLVARMGGDFYCRASGKAVFQVPKPNTKIGIGIDQIPETIRFSKILTGNHLGILGNVESLPAADEIRNYIENTEGGNLTINNSEESLHHKAIKLIEEGKTSEAWMVLLSNKI